MKKLHLLLPIIFIGITTFTQAQKLQTYQGTTTFPNMLGASSGTEKYSYIVDDRGYKKKHGAYSYNGKSAINNRSAQMTGTHVISANYKLDSLDGTYASTASFSGKIYQFPSWTSFTASSKLGAVFANGKPNGTFTASYNGDVTLSGTATMKNGKYIGSYNYSGFGEQSHIWKIKGQLTPEGKLTGNWQIEDVANWSSNYLFLNDVIVGGDRVSPTEEKFAKQFAEGKISEEQLMEYGFVVKEGEIPLHYFIEFLLFYSDDDDDYGLEKMGGYNFQDYGPKKYYYLSQLSTISQEGLQALINSMMEQRDPNNGYEKEYTCNKIGICKAWCKGIPQYDNDYKMYYLECDPKFNEWYGSSANSDYRIYLSNQQYETLSTYRDSIAILGAYTYGSRLFKLFIQNKSKALDFMINNQEYDSEESINKYLQKFEEINTSDNNRFFSSDSNYLIIHEDGHYSAWVNICNDLQNYKTAIAEAKDSVWKYNKIISTANSKGRGILGNYYVLFNQYQYREGKGLRERAAFAEDYLNVRATRDSIERNNKILSDKLKGEVLRDYTKTYESIIYKTIDSEDDYNSYKLEQNALFNLQKEYLIVFSLLDTINKNHSELKSICGKKYEDIFKSYSSLYENGIKVPIPNNLSELQKATEALSTLKNDQKNMFEYIDDLQKEEDIIQSLENVVDKANEELKTKSGKLCADMYKSYSSTFKEERKVVIINNLEELRKITIRLQVLNEKQKKLMQYVDDRYMVESLNSEIMEESKSAKNCQKAYMIFYKDLQLKWDDSKDNYQIISDNIKILTKIKAELKKSNLNDLNEAMKKVKTPDQFKSALNL